MDIDEIEFRKKLDNAKKASSGQLLIKGGRLINQMGIERIKKRFDLPTLRPAHMSLVPYIEFDGSHLTELAKQVGHTKQVVGRLVDDMERMGMVQRCSDPNDKRSKLIKFSDQGKRWIFEGLLVLNEIEQELSQHIGEAQMKSLHALLLKVVDRLEQKNS